MSVTPEKVKQLAEEDLLKKRGIIGISVKHHSPKIIRIYVEKLDPALLKTIPKKYLGYDVQVIEVGRIKPLLSPEERVKKWRPIIPGISIGSVKVTAGTLTCIARDNTDGEYVLLSNYHVFFGTTGERIVQPGPYDGGTIEDTVGFLKRFVPVSYNGKNYIDSAIASLTVDFIKDDPDLGSPVRVRDPVEGETVVKSGRTTAITRATVIDDGATIKIYDYPGVGTVYFDDIVITHAFAEGGDSGSAAYGSDGSIVGQVFAGSDKVTCLIKMTRIMESLKITPLFGIPRFAAPIRAGMPLLLGLVALPIIKG